jgi:hypothetical protein
MRIPIKGYARHVMEGGRYERLMATDYRHYLFHNPTTSTNPDLNPHAKLRYPLVRHN